MTECVTFQMLPLNTKTEGAIWKQHKWMKNRIEGIRIVANWNIILLDSTSAVDEISSKDLSLVVETSILILWVVTLVTDSSWISLHDIYEHVERNL